MDFLALAAQWLEGLRPSAGSPLGAALFKSAVTVVCVACVLWAGGKFGERVSGVLAGLPIVTAPTLIWLATRDVPDFAIRAAVNAMSATAAYGFFALAYAWLCSELRARFCLAVALAVSLVLAALFVTIPASREQTFFIAILVCAVIRWFMPNPEAVPPNAKRTAPGPSVRIPIWMVALNSGLVCGSIVYFSDFFPAHYVGMLAALPIIGSTVAYSTHLRNGVMATRKSLVGYVDGCMVKILFCFVFAHLLRSNGLVQTTIISTLVCAAVVMLMNVRAFLPKPAEANAIGHPAEPRFTRLSAAATPATSSW